MGKDRTIDTQMRVARQERCCTASKAFNVNFAETCGLCAIQHNSHREIAVIGLRVKVIPIYRENACFEFGLAQEKSTAATPIGPWRKFSNTGEGA